MHVDRDPGSGGRCAQVVQRGRQSVGGAGRAGGSRPAGTAASAGSRAATGRCRAAWCGPGRPARGRAPRRRTPTRPGPGRPRRGGRGRSDGAPPPTRSPRRGAVARDPRRPASRRRVSTRSSAVATATRSARAPSVIRWKGCDDLGLAGLDPGQREVRLEQQRLPLRRHDLRVDLDQRRCRRARSGSPARRGPRPRRRSRRCAGSSSSSSSRAKLLADQPDVVGVDDGAVGGPQLDASYVADQQALRREPVEAVERPGVTGGEAPREGRLGDRVGEQAGRRPGIGERLLVGRVGGEEAGPDHDGGQRQQPDGQEQRHRAPQDAPPGPGHGSPSMARNGLRHARNRGHQLSVATHLAPAMARKRNVSVPGRSME